MKWQSVLCNVLYLLVYLQALFPVSFLFSRSFKFPARNDDILKQYKAFPHLSTVEQEISATVTRKIHLELNLG